MGLSKADKLWLSIKGNLLTILTISGVVAGVSLGFILRESKDENYTDRQVMYVKFIGDIFLRMLNALILPLIISSLITAVGSLDLTLSKKIGGRAIAYYMITTLLAIALGIILVSTIKPGSNKGTDDFEKGDQEGKNVTTADTLMDLVRNMFPPNLIEAALNHYATEVVYPGEGHEHENSKNDWKIEGKYEKGTNIMGLVVFAAILGVTLSKLQAKGKPLLDFFTCLSESMMVITHWVIWLSPFGICFLVAAQIIDADDLGEMFEQQGMYFLTVVAGIFVHGFIVLPLIFIATTRTMPFTFIRNMVQALTTAFGTSSSSATLPITIECLEGKNGVDPRVSRFVLPIGATINMDGTALYEAVAAIFISQVVGKDLSAGDIIAVSITATAASIGAAGIPQAGLVTLVMVLNTVGLPAEYVSYIVPVDWLLDRFRTVVNVLGDSLGAGIVDRMSKKDLKEMDMENPPNPNERLVM